MKTTVGSCVKFIILPLTLLLFFLSGCSSNCFEKTVEYYEAVPTTLKNSVVSKETYTYMQPYVETVCGKNFSYSLNYSDKVWLDKNLSNKYNTLKRIVYLTNKESQLGEFGFKMIYVDGSDIIKTSDNITKTFVSANATKKLFLLWKTTYGVNKDVKLSLENIPQFKDSSTCKRVVKYTNTTGIRNLTKNYNTTKTSNVIKTKKILVCD